MNISIKTLPVTSAHFDGTLEYEVHNLYALYQAKATADALRAIRQKRHFIFTRCAAYLLSCSRGTGEKYGWTCSVLAWNPEGPVPFSVMNLCSEV